nr:hypothetical protein [uncultured archaeon]
MGCHTWFSAPYETDKKKIINLAQEWLNKTEYISAGHRKMYQWAIDNELEEPVCELATFETECNRNENWILYKDIRNFSVEKYNKENGTSYYKYDTFFDKNNVLESYSDEPRIGGYPDDIIHSYDEMVEFMKTGYTDKEGKHFDFHLDEDRKEMVMNGIKTFFTNHPQGIITFG